MTIISSDMLHRYTVDYGDDFSEAVEAISKIDFSACVLEELNVFETSIRY
jgi:hypothetical protein